MNGVINPQYAQNDKIVEILEQRMVGSAFYTIELACQQIKVEPENLSDDNVDDLINAIISIFKEIQGEQGAEVIYNHLIENLRKQEEDDDARSKFVF